MKKILVLFIISLFIVSCGDNNNKIEKVDNKKIEKNISKYYDLTKYIKSNITDKESEKLLTILEERVKKQSDIKKLLEDSTKENSDETYKKILSIRTELLNELLPYIEIDKNIKFKTYFNKYNKIIKKALDNKLNN